MIVGVGIFFLLPSALAKLVDPWASPRAWSNSLIEGLIRIVLFVVYIGAIGFVPDIRRVFAYHGAEHKTINALEDHQPAGARDRSQRYTTAHARCGTSFLLIVLVISIMVFAPFHFEQWSAAPAVAHRADPGGCRGLLRVPEVQREPSDQSRSSGR